MYYDIISDMGYNIVRPLRCSRTFAQYDEMMKNYVRQCMNQMVERDIEVCSICLEYRDREMNIGRKYRGKLACGHVLCLECYFALPSPNFSCPLCRFRLYKFRAFDELMRDELKFIQIQKSGNGITLKCPCCSAKVGKSCTTLDGIECVSYECHNCGIVQCDSGCKKCGSNKWKRCHDIYETCYYCNLSVRNWTIKKFPKGKGYYFNPPTIGYKGSYDEWCLRRYNETNNEIYLPLRMMLAKMREKEVDPDKALHMHSVELI